MTTTYTSELGRCYKKSGMYRIYKQDGVFTLFLVAKELHWNSDNTAFKVGTKLEAVRIGYISDLENFEMAVEDHREETAYMMARGA